MNIGASVVIKGTITAGEDLEVAGRVEGDICLQQGRLLLGPGSQVVGDIVVPSVVVHGNIEGNLTATERVEVRPGASIVGSVAARTLLVTDGAQLNCRVEMPAMARPQPVPVAVPPRLPVAV